MKSGKWLLVALSMVFIHVSLTNCATSEVNSNNCSTQMDETAPNWIADNFTCLTTTVSGGNIALNTTNIPNHNSYYFGEDDERFEALPSGNNGNPNSISEQDITITIDMSPSVAGSASATSGGSVGMTVGGVAIFNNQANPPDVLEDELETMDQANGHPTHIGMYHHHTEPLKLTNDDGKLVGVMADGFPVFGRKEPDGSTPTYVSPCTVANALTTENCQPHAAIPNFHCHTLPTSDYGQTLPKSSDGAAQKCHYHVISVDPYIIEKYAGAKGAISTN